MSESEQNFSDNGTTTTTRQYKGLLKGNLLKTLVMNQGSVLQNVRTEKTIQDYCRQIESEEIVTTGLLKELLTSEISYSDSGSLKNDGSCIVKFMLLLCSTKSAIATLCDNYYI